MNPRRTKPSGNAGPSSAWHPAVLRSRAGRWARYRPRPDPISLSYSTRSLGTSVWTNPPTYSTVATSTSTFVLAEICVSFSTSSQSSSTARFGASGMLYQTIDASRSTPWSFALASSGQLYMANGMGPALVWDGFNASLFGLGLASPATAPIMAGVGQGGIVGTYTAYVRFIDQNDNPSNLSPVSDPVVAQNITGTVTNVTAGAPPVVTSPSHGLTTGAVINLTTVAGLTNVSGTFTIAVLDPNTFSLTGVNATGVYKGGGIWSSGVASITYTGVAVPSDTSIVARRQLLRNTAGQAATYYVDIDTTDLLSTTFTSSLDDNQLQAQVAVPLFDAAGALFANRFGVPPAHKAVLANHQGRMFLTVEYEYSQGCVSVAFGSETVTGIGTEWNPSFIGRFIYVVGSVASYEIANVSGQTVTLKTPYQGPTHAFAVYAIRPAPAERRLIYYSEPDVTQAWPAVNAVALNEDGDEITGLMSKGSFLYILERRHIYRLTFQSDPAADGGIFITAERGCINNRSWVHVEDKTYMLDEFGIYAFSGGQQAEIAGLLIMDLFRPSTSGFHINWGQSRWFHAAHFPGQETIRWFVTLSGNSLPRHALCYSYRHQRWWIEEYPFPVSASTYMLLDFARTIVGGDAGSVHALWGGALDVADATLGTVQGSVTSAGLTTLTDQEAVYASSRIVGAPVVITAGRGKGQLRRIAAASGPVLTLSQPWLVVPDATSVYQVGGIPWQWQSGWFRYLESDDDSRRRVEVQYEPLDHPATFDIHLFEDWSVTGVPLGLTISATDNAGVGVVQGSDALTVDLTKSIGFVQQRLDSRRELDTDGPRFLSVTLNGVAGQDPVFIFGLVLDGVGRE